MIIGLSFKNISVPLSAVLVLIFVRFYYGVLLFHTLAELFSILVGVLMLVIVWNTRRFTQNDFLLYLGIGYFWIAILDTWHTFTIKGMPFFTITDAEITLHFWIYTRLIEALLLLSAVLFLKKKLNANLAFYTGAGLVLLVIWASLVLKQPIMLTPDGLTIAKVSVEYVVMALLIMSGFIYIRNANLLSAQVLKFLMASIVLTFCAEISFTLYTSFTGIPFVIGHLFKFLSFWMVYQAIVRTTLTEPFSVMAQASSTYEAIPHPAIVIDSNGIISQVNQAAAKLAGKPVEELVHQPVHDLFHPSSIDDCQLCKGIKESYTISDLTVEFAQKDRWFIVSQSLIKTGEMAGGVVQLFTDITDRKQVEKKLHSNEERLSQLVETLPYGVQECTLEGKITFSNSAHHRIYGLDNGELIGSFIWDNQPDSNKQEIKKYLAYLVKEMPQPKPYITTNIDKDGQEKTLEIVWDYQRNNHGKVKGFISVISDITERKKSEQKIRLLSAAVEQSPVSIVMTDINAKIEYTNPAFSEVTGYSLEEAVGKNPSILKSGKTSNILYKELWQEITKGQSWDCEFENRKKSGELFWEHAHFSSVKNSEGIITHYLAIKEDITKQKKQQEKILQQAHFDTLTGIPNRFLSLDRLNQLIIEAERNKKRVAILFIDLDDFKTINDSLGHEMGDNLLIEASARLSRVIRSGDTVGRLGGDEFIVLLGGLDNDSEAQPVAENLLGEFRKPFQLDNRELMITASLGISIFPDDGKDASELLRNADSAMYHSKDLGRNTYSYFTDAMNQNVLRRLSLEEQIHGALERNEFTVFYQPKIVMETGEIMGAEALLRWNNPALGSVSPDEFIPIAEQTGLIIPIGQYVLTEAIEKTADWQKTYNPEFKIAVNVSPNQFRDPELVPYIIKALNDGGIKNDYLELEITEGVLMSGHSYIDKALEELNDLKISIAMDDFGTGYSSLSYLRSYPFNILKIDRSFINDITFDGADRELTNAAIAMAHALNLKVVAEGVETKEQLDLLKTLNCDYGQGYLFSKPVNAEEFSDILKGEVSI